MVRLCLCRLISSLPSNVEVETHTDGVACHQDVITRILRVEETCLHTKNKRAKEGAQPTVGCLHQWVEFDLLKPQKTHAFHNCQLYTHSDRTFRFNFFCFEGSPV